MLVLTAFGMLLPMSQGSMPVTGAGEPLSISIVEESAANGDASSRFHVAVTNVSLKPLRIWEEWNSWGYYGLSFELTDKSGKQWKAFKKQTTWKRNFPSYKELKPGGKLMFEVSIGDLNRWEGLPRPEKGSSIVMMQAVLEYQTGPDSLKLGVWTGRINSMAKEFTFYP